MANNAFENIRKIAWNSLNESTQVEDVNLGPVEDELDEDLDTVETILDECGDKLTVNEDGSVELDVDDEDLEDIGLTESEVRSALQHLSESNSRSNLIVDGRTMMLEKVVKKVVDGKVVKKKVKSKKKRLTPKQKAALAKARKKAHKGSANKARRKSMKIRRKKLGEGKNQLQDIQVNDLTEGYVVYDIDTNTTMKIVESLGITSEGHKVKAKILESNLSRLSESEADILVESGSRLVLLKK